MHGFAQVASIFREPDGVPSVLGVQQSISRKTSAIHNACAVLCVHDLPNNFLNYLIQRVSKIEPATVI